MPKIAYIQKSFRESSLQIIEQANDIIANYQAIGFFLSLRQLYYQFVSRGYIPNNEKSYSRLGDIISDGRLAGLIDWDSITDRTRNLLVNPHWDSPEHIIENAASGYLKDFWIGQTYRPEVWIEKNALIDVIAGVCRELDVPHFACIGYNSQTEMWNASQRLLGYINEGYEPIILHLGDHDPSGIDMTRDTIDRLTIFMGGIEVKRLALNIDQVQLYNPPPNPAKMTDSRFKDYLNTFGEDCWELDALEPQVIANLVRDSIENLIDEDVWEEKQTNWKSEKDQLLQISRHWDDVLANLNGN